MLAAWGIYHCKVSFLLLFLLTECRFTVSSYVGKLFRNAITDEMAVSCICLMSVVGD